MAEQSYMIAVDAQDDSVDITAIKNVIKQETAFTHWWNHLPAVFLVTSALSADEITDRVRLLAGDARFLVIGVRMEGTQGWLPEQSWKGIRHRESEIGRHDPRQVAETSPPMMHQV